MVHVLLAIYVVAAWSSPTRAAHWHEFQLPQHFFNRSICERYRHRLVAEWVADPAVPFHQSNIVSSRCGPWKPDPDAAIKLWNGEVRYGENL